MSIWFMLAMIPVAYFLWWVGFVATKRMRIEKNKERAALAKKNNIDLPQDD